MTTIWEMIFAWIFSACLFLMFSVSVTLMCGEVSVLSYLLKVSAVIEGIIIFASIWDYFNG